MAVNENPSRIDQVFADRRLIDEALIAAAADAIDRHRRAGTPVVLCQDGRIEHVPADLLVPDFDTLLANANFDEERTAKELIAWFEDRFSTVNRYRLVKEATLGRNERFKWLYLFALWLRHLYADREDVICSLGSTENADSAIVKDGATDHATMTYVQLTTVAIDFHESWRKPVTQGFARPWEPASVSQDEKLRRTLTAIERAVGLKSRLSWGPDHVLVVGFDDFMWFGTDDDRAALTSFVGERLETWQLKVKALYIVGLSGRTFLSFPITRR